MLTKDPVSEEPLLKLLTIDTDQTFRILASGLMDVTAVRLFFCSAEEYTRN